MSFINGIPSDSEKLKGESLNRPGKKKKSSRKSDRSTKRYKKVQVELKVNQFLDLLNVISVESETLE